MIACWIKPCGHLFFMSMTMATWTRALNYMSAFFKTLFESGHSSVIYVHTEKSRYISGDMVTLYLLFFSLLILPLFYVCA